MNLYYQAVFDNFIDMEFMMDLNTVFGSFNYVFDDKKDINLLNFIAMKEIKTLLSQTNQIDIPEGLREYLTNKIAGAFLKSKYVRGDLGSDFDFDTSVKSLSEGSFKYEFNSNLSGEEKFLAALSQLIEGDNEWVRYRKFRW